MRSSSLHQSDLYFSIFSKMHCQYHHSFLHSTTDAVAVLAIMSSIKPRVCTAHRDRGALPQLGKNKNYLLSKFTCMISSSLITDEPLSAVSPCDPHPNQPASSLYQVRTTNLLKSWMWKQCRNTGVRFLLSDSLCHCRPSCHVITRVKDILLSECLCHPRPNLVMPNTPSYLFAPPLLCTSSGFDATTPSSGANKSTNL